MGRKKQASPKTICDQLREAIEASGLSHYRIAKDAGIKPEMIGRFMKGERDLRAQTFAKIAFALGLELAPKKENENG